MKRNIAIVGGGNSSEWVISVQSADMLANEFKNSDYNTYVVQIRGNEWKVKINNDTQVDINKGDFSFYWNGDNVKFNCAIIAIHGTPGEDGKLQAYFELLDIPYTSCGILASSLTFNKNACKVYLKNYGILSAKAVLLKKGDKIDIEAIEKELQFPCFVKPNESGSSFGISKIENSNELLNAVEHAKTEGEDVIIEEFIKGTEVTCGLVKTKANTFIFPITEIVSKKEFFDYEAKYTPGMSDEIIPARINEEMAEKVRKTSSAIYDAVNCRGIVRIDYIISGNSPYFLEVNTVPGMSPNSIVPKQIREAGLNITEVYKLIIEDVCS